MGAIAKVAGDLIGYIPKLIGGVKQKKMAKNLKRSDGFDYVAPELKENRDLAKQGAYSNRSFDQGVDEANLRKMAAGGQYAANLTGNAAKKLAGSSMSTNNYLNKQLKLRSKGRNERLGRVDKYMAANSVIGQVKSENEKRFQDTKTALEGASMENIYGGLSNIGDSISKNANLFDKPVKSNTLRTDYGGFRSPSNTYLNKQSNSPYNAKFTDF